MNRFKPYILTLDEAVSFLGRERNKNIVLCVKGEGRSPEMAYRLTETGFPAVAILGGLSLIKQEGNRMEVARVLVSACNVISSINLEEQKIYGTILRAINQYRTRRVIISENFAWVLSEMKTY